MKNLTLFSFVAISILLQVPSAGVGSPPQQQRLIIPPAQYKTVPFDLYGTMEKQSDKLGDLDKRLALVEKTVNDMSQDMKSLVATDNVMEFVIGSFKILVPGLIIAAFGVWFSKKLDRRKPSGVS